jgi:hypothetical protein
MEPKTFGDKCGLDCKCLDKFNIEHSCWHGEPKDLKFDPTTNQILRTDQCLADYPVEE